MLGHSAEGRQLRGLLTALEKPRDEKKARRAEAEVDHRQEAALQALVIQREQADHDESQMTDAAVGEQAPEDRLNQGIDGAVDDRREPEAHHDEDDRRTLGGLGQQRNAEAHKPEGAELNARQDDGHGNGAFQQGIGQPGMKRKHRRLERESHEHEPENQNLLRQRNGDGQKLEEIERVGLVHVMQRGIGMVVDIQERDADEHEYAAQQRVEDVFQCGVMPLGTASPEFDQKVAGNQHQFPEHEEENEIDRDEDTHRRRFERQERHHVQLRLVANGIPGINDHEHGQKDGQADEEHADSVDGQVVADAQGRNPPDVLDELHRGRIGNEAHQDEYGQGQFHQRDG